MVVSHDFIWSHTCSVINKRFGLISRIKMVNLIGPSDRSGCSHDTLSYGKPTVISVVYAITMADSAFQTTLEAFLLLQDRHRRFELGAAEHK
jgi:hypothetical protein